MRHRLSQINDGPCVLYEGLCHGTDGREAFRRDRRSARIAAVAAPDSHCLGICRSCQGRSRRSGSLATGDPSSPRDTRSSSVSDSNAFSADYRRGEASDESYRAYRCASQTFDFGSTAEGDTWYVRRERTALLQELLPHVELPAQKEIPGDGEVAVSDLRPWMIPSTPIAIEKIEAGPRSLVSANLLAAEASVVPAGCCRRDP